jgi:integration host factor subunit beta
MNKSELVKALSDEASIPSIEASVYVDTFLEKVGKALLADGRVEIRGFGSFKVKKYKGYKGRNPKSGNSVAVPPKKLPVFRPGKELKDLLNNV